ncbi:hypothetical protein EJB05_49096 [Eragrostis curvula]|uniref:Uncharacterized protein n=1 Tax=Eragrostis curvula TaxID=38414 RepID=A0A5J9T5Z3_9POAL|nr:hypothetical protein EJB05_49096 [Eragrostis curvula]
MAAAVSKAAPASAPPPVPESARPDLAKAKTLMCLCLASLWVGGAGAGAADLTLAFCSDSVVFVAFLVASLVGILVSSVLYCVVWRLLLRCALCGVDSTPKLKKACGPILRKMLLDIAMLEYLGSLILLSLSAVGSLVLMELSMESQPGRIGTIILHAGVLGSAAIAVSLILPATMLKLWRMKPGGAEAADSIV